MKFGICRTSDFCGENYPCKDAVKIIGDENGYNAEYEIEINTLEELLDFIKEQNEPIIISESYVDLNTFDIEIYDTYRE